MSLIASDFCIVAISKSEFDSDLGYARRTDTYNNWTIKYLCPNGGILAVDIADNAGRYYSIAADHIDPCEGIDVFFDYAKNAIHQLMI
jgi:hypothetical protein